MLSTLTGTQTFAYILLLDAGFSEKLPKLIGLFGAAFVKFALAAFAGAGVAGAPPMRTAVEAFKLAGGLFLIPLMMAYAPLLLNGDNTWLDVLGAGGVTLGLVVAVVGLTERYLLGWITRLAQILLGVAVVLLIYPEWISRITGLMLVAVVAGWSHWSGKSSAQ